MSRSTAPRGRLGSPTSQALAAVRTAPTILEALRRVDVLTRAASHERSSESLRELRLAVVDPADGVTALAAVHALGALPQNAGVADLVALLRSADPFLADHAAWALWKADPDPEAIPPLVGMVANGALSGMLAQRTLELWAPSRPDLVLPGLEESLLTCADPAARARVVETAGLVPGEAGTVFLLVTAADPAEPQQARAAAAAALGDRGMPHDQNIIATLRDLSTGGGPLGATAALALCDLDRAPESAQSASAPDPATAPSPCDRVTELRPAASHRTDGHAPGSQQRGLTIAQLFLHADIDGLLSSAGKGDTGGIATLLVHLGDALLDGNADIGRVITLSRGRPGADALPTGLGGPGHHYAQVPSWGPPAGLADAWPQRVAARRGIRRVLRAAGTVDVVHLRMADVGSMAAAEAAHELGIPVVLTVAPDPQALVSARESAGTLSRSSFGAADAVEHLAFRDRLLRQLADRADHLVLFPRPALVRDARDLLGLDLRREGHRTTVVAEGIDFRALDRASGDLRTALDAPEPDGPSQHANPALEQLHALLDTLPEHRRELPLAITVGRLHRVKGMGALVEAWAGDPVLSASCNLLVVGGDLEEPSRDELAELSRIDAAIARHDGPGRGLLLAGHQPHATVAAWLAAVRHGCTGRSAAGGIYVSASLKEEFGLAILEAMASSLVVVAPDGGGPATYVRGGVTGILTDTTSAAALAAATRRALDLAASPTATERAARELATLRERFSIDTMATALGEVYADASGRRADGRASRPAAKGAAS